MFGPYETKTLADWIGLNLPHIEIEAKVLAGFWTHPTAGALIALLKRAGYGLKSSFYVNLGTPEGQRIRVEGTGNVQRLVGAGTLDGIPHTVLDKQPFRVQWRKDKDTEPPVETDAFLMEQAPLRWTLRTELPYSRVYTTVSGETKVRVIQRYSLSRDKEPWVWEVSHVREGLWKDGLNRILGLAPHYEVELEWMGNKDTVFEGEALERLISLPMSVWQGSEFLLTQPERETLAGKWKRLGLKWINPVSLSLKHVSTLTKDYTVTEKADGLRSMLWVADSGKVLRVDTGENMSWTGWTANPSEVGTVLDGEWLEKLNLFKVFDCLRWQGKDTTGLPFYDEEGDHRLKYVKLWPTLKLEGQGGAVPMRMEAKTFVWAEGSEMWTACKGILETKFDYAIDGLIFTPVSLPLDTGSKSTRWEKLLKWKPPTQNTIDFLVQKPSLPTVAPAPSEPLTGIRDGKPYRLAHLCVGSWGDSSLLPHLQLTGEYIPRTQKPFYAPTRFVAPDLPDAYVCYLTEPWVEYNTIVEFAWNPEFGGWEPLRLREDKTSQLRAGAKQFGNDWTTAQRVWETVRNPVTQDMLTTGEFPAVGSEGYYGSEERKRYPYKDFHASVKAHLYGLLPPNQTLLELGCGRAGDKNRWWKAKVSKVVGLDVNKDGLENEVDGAARRVLDDRAKGQTTPVLFIHADGTKDLSTPDAGLSDGSREYLRLLTGLPVIRTTEALEPFKGLWSKDKMDVVSAQFALHYLLEDPDQFWKNLEFLTHEGSYLMGTVFDGASVWGALVKDTLVEARQDTVPVGYVKREGEVQPWVDGPPTLPVSVWFDSFEKPYVEKLISWDWLRGTLNERGWDLVESRRFTELAGFENLPPSQQALSGLYRTFLFQRRVVPKEKPKKVLRKKKD